MHARLLALVGTVAGFTVGSCSQEAPVSEGDCSVRLRLHGDVHRSVTGLKIPHRGEHIGSAVKIDCEGQVLPALGKAQVFTIPNQKPSQLVIVAHTKSDKGVYMNEKIPWRKRPQLLKDAARYQTCSGPARFTGTWDYVDPAEMANMEAYHTARVPYTGTFSARRGTGVGLDRWAEVTLQGRDHP